FQAEDGIRDATVTGVQTCALPICSLQPLAPDGEGVHVLGPAPAPLHLVRGLFRWRYLVRARRGINVQAFIRAWLAEVKPKGSVRDRKSTRLNSSHGSMSYAGFCLK